MEIISIVCSVVLCLIGVMTFSISMLSRSKGDGILVQKLNQALTGIEELKDTVKEVTSTQHGIELRVQSHDDQIRTLFRLIDSNNNIERSLVAILSVLNHGLGGHTTKGEDSHEA